MTDCPFCGTPFTEEAYEPLGWYQKAVLNNVEDYMSDLQSAKAKKLNDSMTPEARSERSRRAGLRAWARKRGL